MTERIDYDDDPGDTAARTFLRATPMGRGLVARFPEELREKTIDSLARAFRTGWLQRERIDENRDPEEEW